MMRKLFLPSLFFNRKSIYPGFLERNSTITIDLIILLLILLPVSQFLGYLIIDESLMKAYQDWQVSQIEGGGEQINREELKYFQSKLLVPNLIKNLLLAILAPILLVVSWYHTQTTPGKWFFRLYIVDSKSGGKPTLKQLILRAFGVLLTMAPLGLGYLFVFTNDKRRAIHDYISGTVVVKREMRAAV